MSLPYATVENNAALLPCKADDVSPQVPQHDTKELSIWYDNYANNYVNMYGESLSKKDKVKKDQLSIIQTGLPFVLRDKLELLGIPLKPQVYYDKKQGIINEICELFLNLRILFAAVEIINFKTNIHHATFYEVFFDTALEIEDIKINTTKSQIKRQCIYCKMHYNQKKFLPYKCVKHLAKYRVKCSLCNAIKKEIKCNSYEHHKCARDIEKIKIRAKNYKYTLKCNVCNYVTRYKNDLESHECTPSGKYKCIKCAKIFSSKMKMYNHVRRTCK